MEFHFETQCPKVERLPEVAINQTSYKNNTFLFPHNNLTHLQALLKDLLELQMRSKLEKYFLQDVLEYSGKVHTELDIIDYLEKPFIVKKVLFSNGSSIYNNTSIFSSTFNRHYLKAITEIEKNNCIFKLGSTTVIASVEFLMILSYLFDKVVLGKSKNDTPFRDTFYAVCTRLDRSKKDKFTSFVQNDMKTLIETKTDITSFFVKDGITNEQFRIFLFAIRPFITKLHIVSVYHISELRSAIYSDKKLQGRTNPIWRKLDTIVKEEYFDITPFEKILEDQNNLVFP